MENKDEDQSLSETNEPWKEPGQTSQDHSIQPPKSVEQEKRKKDANWPKADKRGAHRSSLT